jgi:hypothetical protein
VRSGREDPLIDRRVHRERPDRQLVGVLQASFYVPRPTFGNMFELQVITAVIVGGVSFQGGEGGCPGGARRLPIETVSGSVVSFGIDLAYAGLHRRDPHLRRLADQILHRQRERFQSMAMRERARRGAPREQGARGGRRPDVGQLMADELVPGRAEPRESEALWPRPASTRSSAPRRRTSAT